MWWNGQFHKMMVTFAPDVKQRRAHQRRIVSADVVENSSTNWFNVEKCDEFDAVDKNNANCWTKPHSAVCYKVVVGLTVFMRAKKLSANWQEYVVR